MGGGASKRRVMPSPQEVEDWKTKLEQQKGSARKKSDDLRKKIEELRVAQEEAESADAEAKALQLQFDEDWKTKLEQQKGSARKKSDDLRKKIEELRVAQEEAESADDDAKALQLQLDEARLLAAKASEKRAEAKKAKDDIDCLIAKAREAEEEHRRIAGEIEAMPSLEELLKRVEDAKRASESADAEAKALQLQLDEARLLAAEASEKSPTGGTMGGTASDMCGSQSVSGPEIAGPGVGAAHAAAAATSQGTGGHGAPAPEQSVASSQAAEKTADPKEQIAYLLRLGLNRREVMGVLKSMAESIDPRAPMLVIKYATFKEHGCIPRSSDEKTVPLSKLPADIKVVFISHRWLRPWYTREECEKNGHVWAGKAHPDDAQASKHRLICDGVRKLAESKGWDLEKVVLWVDFAGVEQDDGELLKAGVASLRGYITLSDAVLIPAVGGVSQGSANTVDMVPGGYGARAWTRLEAMSMYAVSVLKQVEAPEIFVAAGDGASFLERFDYVLDELPSKGEIFDEKDREYIRGHEEAFLREIEASVERNGYIAKHGGTANCVAFDPKDASRDLVASGGDDEVIKLVNRKTGTAVWSVEIGTGVNSLAFNKDGSMLAAGGKDGVVRVWAVASGSRPVERCTLTGHSGEVTSVAWSPDGETLASGSCDNTVRLWTREGKEKGTLTGHSDYVLSVAWNEDGTLLASGSYDETVKIWDMSSGSAVEKCTLTGHVASWQQMDAGTKALATKVKKGWSAGGSRSGQYIVTAEGDMVYVYLATSEGEKHGESLAAFRSPSNVQDVCCRGTCVVVGCSGGQVLFLEGPLLARAAG